MRLLLLLLPVDRRGRGAAAVRVRGAAGGGVGGVAVQAAVVVVAAEIVRGERGEPTLHKVSLFSGMIFSKIYNLGHNSQNNSC